MTPMRRLAPSWEVTPPLLSQEASEPDASGRASLGTITRMLRRSTQTARMDFSTPPETAYEEILAEFGDQQVSLEYARQVAPPRSVSMRHADSCPRLQTNPAQNRNGKRVSGRCFCPRKHSKKCCCLPTEKEQSCLIELPPKLS